MSTKTLYYVVDGKPAPGRTPPGFGPFTDRERALALIRDFRSDGHDVTGCWVMEETVPAYPLKRAAPDAR